MIDVVLRVLDESYAIMIITNEHKALTKALNERLGCGVTLCCTAPSVYMGDAKESLYCVRHAPRTG